MSLLLRQLMVWLPLHRAPTSKLLCASAQPLSLMVPVALLTPSFQSSGRPPSSANRMLLDVPSSTSETRHARPNLKFAFPARMALVTAVVVGTGSGPIMIEYSFDPVMPAAPFWALSTSTGQA